MKKILVILMIVLFLSGCGDKYKDYKHYELKGDESINYTVHYDDGEANYAIADVSVLYGVTEMKLYGLLYQVEKNDYIILDTFGLRGSLNYSAKFYNDKLYVLTVGSNAGNYVYTLNREKFDKKEFDYNFGRNFYIATIKNIKDNIISFSGYQSGSSGYTENAEYNCPLAGGNCEITK